MARDVSTSKCSPVDRTQVREASTASFERLVVDQIISRQQLLDIGRQSAATGRAVEDLLTAARVPKHQVLRCLSEYHRVPFTEYHERMVAPAAIAAQLDFEELRRSLWFPLALEDAGAKIIVNNPADSRLLEHIQATLKVPHLEVAVALAADIIRFIENQLDTNPNFPPCSGRTPLARLRTWMADARTDMAQFRTTLSVGRTGLAFMRTGVSFVSIALVLFRIFGFGYLTVLEALLMVSGLIITVDGLKWYLPVRREDKQGIEFSATEPTFGTTVLAAVDPQKPLEMVRSDPVAEAAALRSRWNRLTPVMRRRFFAIDRTDMAEERTILAAYRSSMARARTGLAFSRTGIASIGLGIALLRQFPGGAWVFCDAALILTGLAMFLEGFHWYLPGRHAGRKSLADYERTQKRHSIWDFMFPPPQKEIHFDERPAPQLIKASNDPGIYGTTGLALERTLSADRRNIKARVRTVMARSRTGMAFIRTGSRIFSVGLGLSVYFGTGNTLWMIFNGALMMIGLVLIGDGAYWHWPAEKIKKQFPFCFGDMEISFPDYATPKSAWKKVVFSHDDL